MAYKSIFLVRMLCDAYGWIADVLFLCSINNTQTNLSKCRKRRMSLKIKMSNKRASSSISVEHKFLSPILFIGLTTRTRLGFVHILRNHWVGVGGGPSFQAQVWAWYLAILGSKPSVAKPGAPLLALRRRGKGRGGWKVKIFTTLQLAVNVGFQARSLVHKLRHHWRGEWVGGGDKGRARERGRTRERGRVLMTLEAKKGGERVGLGWGQFDYAWLLLITIDYVCLRNKWTSHKDDFSVFKFLVLHHHSDKFVTLGIPQYKKKKKLSNKQQK